MLTTEVSMWGAVLFLVPSVTNLGAAEQCLGVDGHGGEKVTLRPWERVDLQLSAIWPAVGGVNVGTPLTWRVYSTIDDYPGAERWDTEPLLQGTLHVADPGMATIRVEGVQAFKVCLSGDPADLQLVELIDAEYRRSVPPAR